MRANQAKRSDKNGWRGRLSGKSKRGAGFCATRAERSGLEPGGGDTGRKSPAKVGYPCDSEFRPPPAAETLPEERNRNDENYRDAMEISPPALCDSPDGSNRVFAI